MSFQKVVTGIVSSWQANLEMEYCPDQIFGKIKSKQISSKSRLFVRESRKDITQRNTEQPAIIIVLESPHTKEFENVKIEPAKGKTGKNIKSYLLKHFSSSFPNHLKNGTEIILVNAIQYQCSLGVDTKVFRDKVFTDVWNHFGKGCFICRLSHIYQEGDYLINACTKGNNGIPKKHQLRRLVEDAIKAVEQNGSHLHALHHSCWHNNGKNDCNKNNNWLWKP